MTVYVEFIEVRSIELSACGNCKSELLENNFDSEAKKRFVRCTNCGNTTPKLEADRLEVGRVWNKMQDAFSCISAEIIESPAKKRIYRKHLSPQEKELIIERLLGGQVAQIDIAHEFGCSTAVVSRIWCNYKRGLAVLEGKERATA